MAHAWDGPLDPSRDPDRYDPTRDPDRYDSTRHPDRYDSTRDPDRYDATRDPDRYDPTRDGHDLGRPAEGREDVDPALSARAGGGRTLTDLLGDGAYEEQRETWVWVVGLVAVFGFLALAAVVLSHLSPA